MINVERTQWHVGKLAKRDPSQRFRRLYRILCDEAWLTTAWEQIRTNKGSKTPGIDGETKDDVGAALITELATKLKEGKYRPEPVRRVYIPKSNGKRRPLGIPTVSA